MTDSIKDWQDRWPTAIKRLFFTYDSPEARAAAYKPPSSTVHKTWAGGRNISSLYRREKPKGFVLTGNESAVLLTWLGGLKVYVDLSSTGNDPDLELRRACAIAEALMQSAAGVSQRVRDEAAGILAFLEGPSARTAFARKEVRERFGNKAVALTNEIIPRYEQENQRRFALQTLDRLAGYPSERLPFVSTAEKARQQDGLTRGPKGMTADYLTTEYGRGSCAWISVSGRSGFHTDPFGNSLQKGSIALYFPYFRGIQYRDRRTGEFHTAALMSHVQRTRMGDLGKNICVAGYEADRYALEWFHGMTSDEARDYLWHGGYVPRGKYH